MKLKIRKIDVIIIVIMMVIGGVVLTRIGIISESEEKKIPNIQFVTDEENKVIIVRSVSMKVLWRDMDITGTCDTTNLGKYVSEGDRITDCSGTIVIRHIPTNTEVYAHQFAPTPTLPSSILTGNMRDVSPEDEGAHFNTIANIREWWYFTVIFSEDSELAGWAATIGFCHLAWGDLTGTFKPDVLVVTLHSPDGKEYGGMINKQRKKILGILGDSTLEAHSPGVDIEYGKSWAIGEAPQWHIHAEDDDIDKENEIIIDLEFFSHSSPLWLHSSRPINQGAGNIANYIFTGCEVSGEVILDGLKFEVKGIGHYEHSWSLGILKTPIKGWDWCHMTLDNGWNIYYSKYYLTKQLRSSTTKNLNPIASLIITTNQGETITILKDIDISIENSDRLFLLLKMPTEMSINAKPKRISQVLLNSYDIRLSLDIVAENTYEKTWRFPAYVGMKVGMNTVTGKISWNDNDGNHEIELNGIGTIWNMRRS